MTPTNKYLGGQSCQPVLLSSSVSSVVHVISEMLPNQEQKGVFTGGSVRDLLQDRLAAVSSFLLYCSAFLKHSHISSFYSPQQRLEGRPKDSHLYLPSSSVGCYWSQLMWVMSVCLIIRIIMICLLFSVIRPCRRLGFIYSGFEMYQSVGLTLTSQ